MTKQEFIDTLCKIRDSPKWHPFFGRNREIRMRHDESGEYCFCPITAVAREEKGETFLMSDFPIAGQAIGINSSLWNRLSAASDCDYFSDQFARVENIRQKKDIRFALELALGMCPPMTDKVLPEGPDAHPRS